MRGSIASTCLAASWSKRHIAPDQRRLLGPPACEGQIDPHGARTFASRSGYGQADTTCHRGGNAAPATFDDVPVVPGITCRLSSRGLGSSRQEVRGREREILSARKGTKKIICRRPYGEVAYRAAREFLRYKVKEPPFSPSPPSILDVSRRQCLEHVLYQRNLSATSVNLRSSPHIRSRGCDIGPVHADSGSVSGLQASALWSHPHRCAPFAAQLETCVVVERARQLHGIHPQDRLSPPPKDPVHHHAGNGHRETASRCLWAPNSTPQIPFTVTRGCAYLVRDLCSPFHARGNCCAHLGGSPP